MLELEILLPLPGSHILLCDKSVSSLLIMLHFLNIFKGTMSKTKQITNGKRTREEKMIGVGFFVCVHQYIHTLS